MDGQSDGKTSGAMQTDPGDHAGVFDMGQRPLAIPLLVVGGIIIWCIVLWLVL
jgi:hypothetical protein